MATPAVNIDPKDLGPVNIDPGDLGPATDVGTDVAKSVIPGLAEGAAGALSPIKRLVGMSYIGRLAGVAPDASDEAMLEKHPIAGPLVRAAATLPAAGLATLFPGVGITAARAVPALESEASSYEPQTTPGRLTKTAASMVPNAAGSYTGGLLKTIGTAAARVLFPGLFSGAAGEATRGTSVEPYARAAGALIGGGVEGLGEAAPDIARAAAATPAQQKAAQVIEKFAGGPVDVDARPIVPGTQPTLLESATNPTPGLAQLHRSIRDADPNSGIVDREAANHQARSDFFNALAGNQGDVESAELARNAVTDKLRDDAFALAKANGATADASGVEKQIYSILKSPDGKRTIVEREMNDLLDKLQVENPLKDRVNDAVGPIQAALQKPGVGAGLRNDLTEARRLLISSARGFTSEDDLAAGLKTLANKQKIVGPIDNALKVIQSGDTKLESDPEMLYGIRKHITDRLSPLASSGDSNAQLAAAKLIAVKNALDGAIEKAAPGYDNYLDTFQNLSKPIDKMKYLQQARLQDANGNLTLPKVQSFLRSVQEARAFKGGIHPAKSLDDEDLNALEALRDDLQGSQRVQLGRAVGSNTLQNAAGAKDLSSVLPARVLPFIGKYVRPEVSGGAIGYGVGSAVGMPEIGAGVGAMVGRGVEKVGENKREEVLKEVANQLLHPEEYQRASTAAKASVNTRQNWWPESALRTVQSGNIAREQGLIGQ